MGRIVQFEVNMGEKWGKVAPFFKAHPDAMAQVRSHVTERDGSVNFETLKIKSVLEMVAGGTPSELDGYRNRTVREWCALLNTIEDGLRVFAAYLEETDPPMTVQQRKMLVGTKKGNIEEAVLWTLRDSYALHGLEDAQNLTVYEYMIARKNRYNDAVVAYNQSMAADAAMRRRG